MRLYVPVRKEVIEPPKEADKSGAKIKSKASKQQEVQQQVDVILPRQDYEPVNKNEKLMKVIESVANKWFSIKEFNKVLS